MADCFDGDVSQLSAPQIKLVLETFDREGYGDRIIKVSPVGKKGDNYVANVLRFVAENDENSLSIVAKVASKIDPVRLVMSTELAFKNEIRMYSKVLPALVQLQKSFGVSEKDLFRYPICYGFVDEAPNEIILLEDLNVPGYNLRDKFVSLTNAEVKELLKNQAKLHALGFALREKMPDLFEETKSSLMTTWEAISGLKEFEDTFEMMGLKTSSLVAPELQERVKTAICRNISIGKSLRKANKTSRFTTINQGDSWTNNIMYSSGTNNNLSCILIDYQLSSVDSPVADLLYGLLNCTDRETRLKHYNDWLDFYYKCLSENLEEFNMKPSNIYPRDKYEADILRYGKYMFGLCVFLRNILSREDADVMVPDAITPNDKEQYDEFMNMNHAQEATVIRFTKNVNEMSKCCAEYGYI